MSASSGSAFRAPDRSGTFAVLFCGDRLFPVSRTTGADRLSGWPSNYRRHMGGVIQTGWRSPVARHRSCVAPGCSLEKTVDNDRSPKPAVLWRRRSLRADRPVVHVYRAQRRSNLGGCAAHQYHPFIRHSFHRAVLRGEEKITPMVLIGVVLLVAGIGFITAR